MPTINEYNNQNGYYIRAHTSDAGNITYKIRDEGRPVVWKHGLRDGDEITWPTIQSFKSLGIIYTDESGTLGPDDFTPNPEQLETTDLSDEEAQNLLEILTSQLDPSAEKIAEIRDILGLSNLSSEIDEISKVLTEHIERLTETGELPVQLNRANHDSVTTTVATAVVWSDEESYQMANLQISLVSQTPTLEEYTHHCIHLCDNHGLEGWHVKTGGESSWERKVTAVQQKSVILPELVSQLEASSFDLGDPAEQLHPTIEHSFE